MAEEVQEEKSSKKGSNIVLIAIIGMLVFLLLIGGIFAVLLFSGGSKEEQVADTSTTQVAEETKASPKGQSKSPKERSNDFLNVGPMYPLDQFVVNLLSESGSRFLKLELNLELDNEKLSPEIDGKKPLIRDIIIRTLTSKTYEDISTAKGKERLKDEIVSRLNEVLRDGYIKNVYFTDFIVQ